MAKDRIGLFVLGATGRVGRLLMAEWASGKDAGLDVLGQCRTGGSDGFAVWALQDGPAALARQISQKVDVMLVLSGITPAINADYSLNAQLAVCAIQAAALAGIGHVLVASSSAVYGRGAGIPIAETSPLAPENPYGRAKRDMEMACQNWMLAHRAGVKVSLLRIGNVAGTDSFFQNLAVATDAAPLQLDQFADGAGPVRSYIGPGTLARVISALCVHIKDGVLLPDVVNIAAPGAGIDMAGFAVALRLLGQPAPVVRRAADKDALAVLRLDTSRLEGLVGFAREDGTPQEMVAQWLRLRGGP